LRDKTGGRHSIWRHIISIIHFDFVGEKYKFVELEHVRENRNACRFLVRKAEGGRDNLEGLGVDGMIILKCLKERNWRARTGFIWLCRGSSSISWGIFLDWLRNCLTGDRRRERRQASQQ
jgi:hypothetical protein